MVIFIGPSAWQGYNVTFIGELAALSAAACFASGLVMISKLPPMPPIASAVGLLTLAGLILLPFCMVIEQPWTIEPSRNAVLALVVLSVVCTALNFVMYFKLISMAGVVFASLNNYIAPVSSMFIGMVFLREMIDFLDIVAVMCIFLSVFLMARVSAGPQHKPSGVREEHLILDPPGSVGRPQVADSR